MSKSRIGITIIGMLIAVISISSCTYRAGYNPGYDYGYNHGYGYGYRYAPPPPRVVVVRPTPPPRVVYRDRGARRYHSERRYNRNFNRQNQRQYGHNGRTRGPR